MAVSAIGIATSAFEYAIATRIDHERVMERLSARVEWESLTIQQGLDEGMLPVAAVAALLGSKSLPTREQFQAVAESAGKLGMMGRLAWAPVVPGEQRAAFEEHVRTELPGYRINQYGADGHPVPAVERPEYVPLLYEALRESYASNLGFDLASDPVRRHALEQARDFGAPVGLQPEFPRWPFGSGPIYAVYWPLYDGAGIPATIAERRRLLTGYVASAVRVSDMLGYAMRNFVGSTERIVFSAASAGEPEHAFASYAPGQGVLVGDGLDAARQPRTVVLRRAFDSVHYHWLLEFDIQAAEVAGMHGSSPLIGSGLLLLLTGLLAYIALDRERRSERERSYRQNLEAASLRQQTKNKALREANERLVRQEEAAVSLALARARLLAVASHDLREPLTAMALFTSSLRGRVNDPVGLELVGNIGDLTQSMQRTFTSLLDQARLDSGAIESNIRPCAVDELVRRLTAEFAREAKLKGLTLRRLGRFPPVETDLSLLEPVLRNLLGNAIKFTDRGGILIAGRVRGSNAAIQVWDTGPGIPETDVERVFHEFERLPSETSKPGFGLGLSIVKQFCREIGATCTVRSRPGRGSCFTVELPLAGPLERARVRLVSVLEAQAEHRD